MSAGQAMPDAPSSYVRTPTLGDVLAAIGELSCRLGAIERHLGIGGAVAALPELREEELRIEVRHPAVPEAAGAMCAAQITHLPTGITVTKESRSGLQAKADALEELRSRVATVQSGTPETQPLSEEKDSTHA